MVGVYISVGLYMYVQYVCVFVCMMWACVCVTVSVREREVVGRSQSLLCYQVTGGGGCMRNKLLHLYVCSFTPCLSPCFSHFLSSPAVPLAIHLPLPRTKRSPRTVFNVTHLIYAVTRIIIDKDVYSFKSRQMLVFHCVYLRHSELVGLEVIHKCTKCTDLGVRHVPHTEWHVSLPKPWTWEVVWA